MIETAQQGRVFRALADESIPIFLVKLHRSEVSFAVDGAMVAGVEACIQGLQLEYTVRRDLALALGIDLSQPADAGLPVFGA